MTDELPTGSKENPAEREREKERGDASVAVWTISNSPKRRYHKMQRINNKIERRRDGEGLAKESH
jgi:hypothetical protein